MGAAEDDGAGVEDQVEDEGAVVDDGGVMGVALKASLSLGRTLLALRECFGTDTLGMRTRLIVESGGAAAALTASSASLRSSSVLPFVEPPERPRIFIFLK